MNLQVWGGAEFEDPKGFMALDQLDPDIQETLLILMTNKRIHEERLRPIANMLHWDYQPAAWNELQRSIQATEIARQQAHARQVIRLAI